jgi:hypothetical protein
MSLCTHSQYLSLKVCTREGELMTGHRPPLNKKTGVAQLV